MPESLSSLALHASTIEQELAQDVAFNAFVNKYTTVNFAIVSLDAAGSTTINISVKDGHAAVFNTVGDAPLDFSLCASAAVWAKYFTHEQELGYQSFWAMYLPQNDIIPAEASVTGDTLKFAQYAAVWRTALEAIHRILTGPSVAEEADPEPEEDAIVGRYVNLDLPKWGGRCKVSGTGDHDILFLHTAGSDGRQYHGVMNDPRMLSRIRMTIFDLPGHGRSFPPPGYHPGQHYNSEDRYIEVIGAIIRALDLKKTIVCGASMDHLVNQSLFCSEFTGGMMAPRSPAENKRLVWHIYSAQAYGMYSGDLDFYFGGFDYRGRVEQINTAHIPVAMLTGEMDFSCRPEMSLATAAKIDGAWIKIMPDLGHFPATESPKKFTTHLLEALDHVEARI
ncbi:hypothetical protein MNV49_002480 [Pseudohyphozyma bogoriensis]|nr:hypothetical protein MNV49_002480 [Pseudohyphozyma bogoriensis]